jgi:hypothetical protein
LVDTRERDNLVIHDSQATACDRSHCELFVSGDAELSHDQHIEIDAQPFGYCETNRNAATRKGEHDDIRAMLVRKEPHGEQGARFGSIP